MTKKMSKVSHTALRKPKEGEDVLLSEETTMYLLDCSGSMRDELDYADKSEFDESELTVKRSMSKMDAVRVAMKKIIQARVSYASADKMGVVQFPDHTSFGDMAAVLLDPQVVNLNALSIANKLRSHGDTPMYQGIEQAAQAMKDCEGLCRLVLVTDGEPNAEYTKDDIKFVIAKLHKEHGFVTDVLGIGLPGVTSSYDEDFLKEVAALGGGMFYPIEDLDALVKQFERQLVERRLLIGDGIRMLTASTR